MTNRSPGTDLSAFDVGGERRDSLFEVLSDRRRRFVLHSLQTAELPVSADELTTEIVAWEARRPVSARSGDERDGIKSSLLHNHLPRMAESGLIDYDEIRQTVTQMDRVDEVRTHLHPAASD